MDLPVHHVRIMFKVAEMCHEHAFIPLVMINISHDVAVGEV